MKVGILGAGAWGSGLAKYLSEFCLTKHEVTIFSIEQEVVNDINLHRHNNKYLKDCIFHNNVTATNNILDLINNDIILITTPVKYIAETIQPLKNSSLLAPLVICSKGIDNENGSLVSDIIKNILPNCILGVLAGPSFATEVAKGTPGALVLAANSLEISENIINKLKFSNIKLYKSDDIIGAQIGGAIKNILAIACGIVHGLDLGQNALAALLCRGTNEIAILTEKLGGQKQTAYGLSGLGDLVLTATSSESRNFSLGLEIAKNNGYSSILAPSKSGVAEGYYTAKIIGHLADTHKLHLPICREVFEILYKQKPLEQSLQDLLSGDIKIEF
ncbi:NAD(P)H-dependent glycerol-3-phosphate dehydrogenase [Rickettsiales bacterium LUAb2]